MHLRQFAPVGIRDKNEPPYTGPFRGPSLRENRIKVHQRLKLARGGLGGWPFDGKLLNTPSVTYTYYETKDSETSAEAFSWDEINVAICVVVHDTQLSGSEARDEAVRRMWQREKDIEGEYRCITMHVNVT